MSDTSRESPLYHLPPLSDSKPKFRRSKSILYNNSSPEWYWKLSPILPPLWIRDGSLITSTIISELEAAWLKYQTLNIPGKGDGADLISARTKRGRRNLEKEYAGLDEDIRRAKEVALARYEGFCIRGRDGSLDYHTDEVVGVARTGLRDKVKGLLGKKHDG